MATVIATGQRVRPPLNFSFVLGFLGADALLWLVLAVAHVVSVATGFVLFSAVFLTFYAVIWTRAAWHHRKVVAAIKAEHGVAVPREALMGLIHDRVTVFTQNGRRYRVEEDEGRTEDGTWIPATVLLIDLGADARTLFGH